MLLPSLALLLGDIGFDELRQLCERFLPAQIACFRGNRVGRALLTMLTSVPTETFLSWTVTCISPRQVWIVELVGIPYGFVRHQFHTEGMALGFTYGTQAANGNLDQSVRANIAVRF